MNLAQTKQFKKDVKRMQKRGKDLDKIKTVIDLLLAEEPLPPKNRDHQLGGN
jgi:mRNA interferase YafQ